MVMVIDAVIGFFFFKQKTAYEIVDCDWSSDVCSSDLQIQIGRRRRHPRRCQVLTAALARTRRTRRTDAAA